MAVSEPQVRKLFAKLEVGDGQAFFAHVADNVDWTVLGTHPLAGRYRSKEEFFAHTFARLNKILVGGTQLHVEAVHVAGDWAVVELRSMATDRNGMRFDNRYCWVVRFEKGLIVEVRAYLDSMLVSKLFEENPVGAEAS